MFIATLDASGNAVSTERSDHGRTLYVGFVEHNHPVQNRQATLNGEEEKIPDAEVHRGVTRIENPDTLLTTVFRFLHLHLLNTSFYRTKYVLRSYWSIAP